MVNLYILKYVNIQIYSVLWIKVYSFELSTYSFDLLSTKTLTHIFNLITFLNTYPTFYYLTTTIENDDSNMHFIATNDHQAENRQPIKRSRRLQHRQKECEDLKHSFSDENSK